MKNVQYAIESPVFALLIDLFSPHHRFCGRFFWDQWIRKTPPKGDSPQPFRL
jgi:hypothetical protein